jgi:hypothetical protein
MIIIVGAGMAGLLAANMLRHRDPKVIEKQEALPNNHSAVLRFRTSTIGDILGVPFKRVRMTKCVKAWHSPVADILAYSDKNTGMLRSDRSITDKLIIDERFIAPRDLVSSMAARVVVHYGAAFDFGKYGDELIRGEPGPVVSTLPMPYLMEALHYPRRDKVSFDYVQGINIRATVENCDAYISVYVPDPSVMCSRISITGNELIVEIPLPGNKSARVPELAALGATDCSELRDALDIVGIAYRRLTHITISEQRYAKIVPIDDNLRKEFIFWATDQHNIFSLGRFATWRPGLLLDDLVQDIRLIDRWSGRTGRYDVVKSR